MKEKTIFGNSKGYIERIISFYKSVKIEVIRNYFMSSDDYMNLNIDGETWFTVNKLMAEMKNLIEDQQI